jgi:transcriptional regulator with XRE-family HTH domain
MYKQGDAKMYNLYNRIMDLCKAKGVSGSRMCLELGLSKSTLSDIKAGRKKGISTTTAQKIAAYFDVPVDYLLGNEDKKEKPADEGELSEDVIIFHRDGKTVKKQFTKEQMDMLLTMIDAIPEKPKKI